MPCRLRRLKMCSITGASTIGTIGLGRPMVRGRRREPSPPAMTTAFMDSLSSGAAPLRYHAPCAPTTLVNRYSCQERRDRQEKHHDSLRIPYRTHPLYPALPAAGRVRPGGAGGGGGPHRAGLAALLPG